MKNYNIVDCTLLFCSMFTTVVCRRMCRFKIAIDIQTVRTTYNIQIKNILMNKRDNNYFLSTKDYSYLIEQVRKSKLYLVSSY